MSALDDFLQARQAPPKAANQGNLGVLLGLVIGVLACLCFTQFHGCDIGGGDGQHHQHVEPVEGGVLVLVSDKQFPTADQVAVTRDLPAFVESRHLEGFLWLDDEESASEGLRKYAESKRVKPPLMAYVKDKQIKRVAKWTAAGNSELESFLK